jgi:O-antigen/teichoic acid export membrane protein
MAASICMPIVIKNAGSEAFALLSLIWMLIGYFSFLDLGMSIGLTHKIAIESKGANLEQLSRTIVNGLFFTISTGIIGAIILWNSADYIAHSWLNVSFNLLPSTILSLKIAAIAIPITTVSSGIRGIFEGFEQFKFASLIKGLFGALIFFLPAILASKEVNSIVFMTISLVFARLIMLIGYLVSLKTYLNVKIDFSLISIPAIKNMLSYTGWVAVSNIASQLIPLADRAILSKKAGMATVAFFGLPFEMMSRILIIPASAVTVLLPFLSSQFALNNSDIQKFYSRTIYYSFALSVLIFFPLAIFSSFILSTWIDESFAANAKSIFSILAIGFLAVSVAHIPLVKLQSEGRTKEVAIFYLLQVAVYIPSFYFIVTKYGIQGGALIWCIRSILDATCLFLLAKKN